MTSYERKLDEFADGKNFVRLSRPVRDRADASCDACGSTQPGPYTPPLKDQDSERYFFIGDTYLKELVKRGVIRRRFGRDSGQVLASRGQIPDPPLNDRWEHADLSSSGVSKQNQQRQIDHRRVRNYDGQLQ